MEVAREGAGVQRHGATMIADRRHRGYPSPSVWPDGGSGPGRRPTGPRRAPPGEAPGWRVRRTGC